MNETSHVRFSALRLHRVRRDCGAADDPWYTHNGHFVLSLNIFSWNEFGERQTATHRCIISAANVATLNCIASA